MEIVKREKKKRKKVTIDRSSKIMRKEDVWNETFVFYSWENLILLRISMKKKRKKEKSEKRTRKCKEIEQMNVTLNEFLRLHRDSKVGTMIDLFLG